ncbi:MAG: hypothetical protein IIZ64_04335 [Erysipelotrichaceae bacterium]|nr:hypothetical protein [Erysipelotrichaceae bacterium]
MMYFSTGLSFILTIFAAFMWGSWMQVVKHLKGYPITGLIFWLYTFSFVLIWSVTLIVAPMLLDGSILSLTKEYLPTIGRILMGGAMMSTGMFCSLTVMKDVGLILSVTVSGGVGVVLGMITSIMEEGVPESGLFMVLLTAAVYIAAAIISAYASYLRNEDHGVKNARNNVTLPLLGIMLVSAILTNGWSIGTATGTARGIPPVLTCAYMVTGSYLSVLIISLILFTVKKQWKTVFCIGASKTPILLGMISAVCHYGGNLISIYSMPALTAMVSFLLGRTFNLWTIFWGIYYKEFAGISRKTKLFLFTSIVLFLLGTLMLAITK